MTSYSLSPTTLDVIIYQGDDRARARELLEDANIEAANAGPNRVGDSEAVKDAATAYDEFVTEMAERAITVTVKNLPPKRWREVCRKHPARKDNPSDAAWGYDTEAVAAEVMLESIVAPEFADQKSLDAFLDQLRTAELEEIEERIAQVNDGSMIDPKGVRLASALDQMSDESSKPPARLA